MAWLTGWSNAVKVTVENSGTTAYTDFQVAIDLDSTFPGWSSVNADGSDIRVTDSDGTTLLSIWIETFDTTNQVAKIWVKVPSIPAATTDASGNLVNGVATLYLYYGNSTATSVSDGDATFDLFDDFAGTALDSNKWVAMGNTAGVTVSDGLTLTGDGTNRGWIKSVNQYGASPGYVGILEVNFKYASSYSSILATVDWDGNLGSSYNRPTFGIVLDGFGTTPRVSVFDNTVKTDIFVLDAALPNATTDYNVVGLVAKSVSDYEFDYNYSVLGSGSQTAVSSFSYFYVGVASRELNYATYIKWLRLRKYSASVSLTVDTTALTPGTAYAQDLSDGITVSEVYVRGAGRALVDTFTVPDYIIRAVVLNFSDSATLADVFGKVLGLFRSFVDSISVADVRNNTVEKISLDGITLSDLYVRSVAQYLSDSISPADVFLKQLSLYRSLEDGFSLSDSIGKMADKYSVDLVSLTDDFDRVAALHRIYTDVVSPADNVAKSMTVPLIDTFSLVDSFARVFNAVRSLTEAVQFVDNTNFGGNIAQLLIDTLSVSDLVIRTIMHVGVETILVDDKLSKSLAKAIDELVGAIDKLSRSLSTVHSELLSISDVRSVGLAKEFDDTIAASDSMLKSLLAVKSDLVAVSDVVSRGTSINLEEISSFLDNVAVDLENAIKSVQLYVKVVSDFVDRIIVRMR